MNCDQSLPVLKKPWSPAQLIRPVDNIRLHKYTYAKPFCASFEKDEARPNMSKLMGCEYFRVWQEEHNQYLKLRNARENPKWIRPVFQKGKSNKSSIPRSDK